MQEQLDYILSELRSAWRFRWLALAAAWLVCLGGWVYVTMMPDVYEASARVYVDTSSELRRILQGQIIEPDLEAQLSLVRESLLGRLQLEEVIQRSALAGRAATSEERAGLAGRLQTQIELDVSPASRGRGRSDNLYTIRYRDVERAVALNVVQTLLDTLVEDTLGERRQGSERSRRFLELQLREHADVLPGSEGGYFTRLQTETSALEDIEGRLELAVARRERIVEQLSGERPWSGSDGASDPTPNSLEGRIQEHESRLEELSLRYTSRHPDVIATSENLARLRNQLEEQRAALAAGSSSSVESPVYQALQISLNEVEVEIASLEVEAERRRARVARLRGSMEEVPEVEAQLARLDRDYDVVHAQYQSLLRSLETERLTREASETDQMEFRVIDPPSVSASPVAPRRQLLLLGVLFAGLGSGGGLAYVLSQLRPVFSSPRVLRDVTGLPLAGVVSLTWKERHKLRRRAEIVSFSIGCLALLGVFAAVFLLEITGEGLRTVLGL